MLDHRTEIIANAARLLGDAKFLSEHNRFASAFALAVLGLEEIGKVTLDIWGDLGPLPSNRSAHLRKQTAIGSLLLAAFAVKNFQQKSETISEVTDSFVEAVARAFYESREGKFLRNIDIGALEKTKQLGIYRDDWLFSLSLHANQFQKSDVTSILEAARNAITSLSDDRTSYVGRAIYEVHARGHARII